MLAYLHHWYKIRVIRIIFLHSSRIFSSFWINNHRLSWLYKRGTIIVAPVSSLAGFFAPVTVSPFTASSVSTTLSFTLKGGRIVNALSS